MYPKTKSAIIKSAAIRLHFIKKVYCFKTKGKQEYTCCGKDYCEYHDE